MPSNIVLIIGSAPDAIRVKEWSLAGFDKLVAINNAWQIRDDWDYLIYPDDLPLNRLPVTVHPHQNIVTSESYVPAQNQYGGFVYAGGTMSFTAAYWVLAVLRPSVIAFVGCDMVYAKDSPTHFYGQGSADPLRDDVTLQSLEAKSTRLQVVALENNCMCVNLTSLNESRLVFPKIPVERLLEGNQVSNKNVITDIKKSLSSKIEEPSCRQYIEAVKAKEVKLDFYIENGKYWQHLDELNAEELYLLDQRWLTIYNCFLK